MHHGFRTLGAVAMTAIVLAAIASSAMANRAIELVAGEGELERVTARGTLTVTEPNEGFRVICTFTRTMRLNPRINKAAGNEIGQVTAVEVRGCRGGVLRVLPESLPWTMSYLAFLGTLPNIEGIAIETRGTTFLLEAFFGVQRCLYGGNLQSAMTGNPIANNVLVEAIDLPLVRDLRMPPGACPSEIFFRGTLTVGGRVRMRLS
ncbi:MAG: hypothetical protein WBC33_13525 [Conexibacter sp.]